MASVTNYCVLF